MRGQLRELTQSGGQGEGRWGGAMGDWHCEQMSVLLVCRSSWP